MENTQTKYGKDNRTKILVAICASAVVIPIVFTGPAVSTAAVGRDLGGDLSSLTWMVNGYAIAFGGFVMAAGALGDQIGRKRCFIAGLSIFTITALLIAMTPGLLLLNLLRAFQGVGGALCGAAAMALLAQEYEGHARTRAFSLLGTSFGAGLAFGPLTSGFFIDLAGWRSFYVAIAAVSVAILLLGCPSMRESRDPAARGIDWPGTVLFTAALVALTAGLVRGPVAGWGSVEIVGLFTAAAVMLCSFILVERRTARPMLDLSLFLHPRFLGVQVLPVATAFSFVALVVYLPIWFTAIQGHSELATGLALLPLTAPMLLIPLLAGRLAKWIPPGLLSATGFGLSAGGALLLMRMSPDAGVGPMVVPMLLIGIGNGLPWGLMDALAISVVPTERAGMAAGIFGTMRVAGESIAIAVIGAALIGLTAHGLIDAAAERAMALPADVVELAAGIGSGAKALQPDLNELLRSAYAYAFRLVFAALATLSAIAAILCMLTLRSGIANDRA